MKILFACVCTGLLALTACGQDPVLSGPYRAVLELPGGPLPFGLELNEVTAGDWEAVLINGQERVAVPDAELDGDSLILVLPAFNTRIDARRVKTGFSGELTLVKSGGKKQVIPFSARQGQRYRFYAQPSKTFANVTGRWAVTFTGDDGSESQAIAEFSQQGSDVQGTFLTPTGDYRFLAGEVRDDQLSLSTFDGSHAFLFTARLDDDGALAGDFWSGTAWHERWVAQRNEAATLPDADRLTQWVAEDVEFKFPDINGEPVSFDDPRFAGKVVVITLAGSWCPNCHDEAAFMAPFYQRYRDAGMEIIALMFEHQDDFASAARQVRAFRDKFNIEYTLLVAGSSDKKKAGETMTMLDRVYAYPTTIFVDRSGAVRRVHTGFQGPGTGEYYTRLVAGFTATVESLLAEK